jgi:hypothetical protein
MQARPATASQLQISKVGFPIRKSADQSLFAAPHGLSQRTTSFIASQRQGIHRIPLRHLIALITNAHRSAAKRPIPKDESGGVGRKDQFCFKHTRERCGQAAPTTEMLDKDRGKPCFKAVLPRSLDRMCFLFTMSDRPRRAFKGLRETVFSLRTTLSRRRPGSGGARRDRTDDLMLAKHALSQLSYGPVATWMNWWAWEDLNLRPHAYQARALTN